MLAQNIVEVNNGKRYNFLAALRFNLLAIPRVLNSYLLINKCFYDYDHEKKFTLKIECKIKKKIQPDIIKTIIEITNDNIFCVDFRLY